MTQKELYYFTGSCLALDSHPEFGETIISHFSSREVNLDDFIYLCSNELILPAIYLIFKEHDLMQVFPPEFEVHLEEIYLMNKIRNEKILQQIEEINKALDSENIMPVYLKGTACLMDAVYSDTGERMIGDIDFLVHEKDYLKTAGIVMGLGYKTDTAIDGDLMKMKHYPRLFRLGGPADVEIHRVPVDVNYSKQFNTELVFRQKKKLSGKVNCYVPSDEHKVIHNFIHSQLCNSGHRFKIVSLRDLYDLHLLSKRVDLTQVYRNIEEKTIAATWFIYYKRVFNLKNEFFLNETQSARRFCNWNAWLLNHSYIHRGYMSIRNWRSILSRYFGKNYRSHFSKLIRGFNS